LSRAIPRSAQVVIIGGGIAGCALAYHLAALGRRDVVLLERHTLSAGTSWHAAGLVSQLRATHALTRLAAYAHELYPRLEAETGRPTGFRLTGGLTVARTAARMEELERGAAVARAAGVEAEVLDPAAARDRWPLMRVEDLAGALYFPQDGVTHPGDTTLALAEGARRRGVTVCERVPVTGILTRAGAVAGVATPFGTIACEAAVNCAGMWARSVGAMAGVSVPLCAAEHMYMLLALGEPLGASLAALRDPDGCIYFRERDGRLLAGGFGPVSKVWGLPAVPEDFAFGRLPPDEAQCRFFLERARDRVPALAGRDPAEVLNGPESFTPDTRPILGEAPEVRNFFVAAGFNSTGIASAPGAARALAEWMAEGHPTTDLWDLDIRRFSRFQSGARYLSERTVESLGLLYAMHWPFRQPETARGVRRSALHDRLAARGACFGVVAGWERPNWYAPPGVEPRYVYSFGRQNWFPYAAEEHRAVRERVGLFDQSSFAKFLLEGPDAEMVLQRLCANDVGGPPGRVVYTAMLNERGGMECDLTVTRLGAERYLIVTSAACGTHDRHWIAAHCPPAARAALIDITSAYAVLGVMGPASRTLLARCTDADLSTPAFPFGACREIDLARAPVRALRITYVGELGWELYVPVEFAAGVYDALVEAGADLGLAHAGYHAMDSLRCEKGYRAWGTDLTDQVTPFEAGLGFAVRLEKTPSFLGAEALQRRRRAAPLRRLVVFTVDDPEPLLYGEEPVYLDGRLAGRVTSAAYGHTLGRSVGFAWLSGEAGGGAAGPARRGGGFEVAVGLRRYAISLHTRPPYDPHGARVRV
jgi:heterotetrameric sarcosine oxidase gamma subunit